MKYCLIALMSVAVATAGCSGGAEEKDNQVSATGTLEHFPTDRQSVQSWLGHEFMIGDKPVKASASVPAADLMKYVGKKVTVTGDWDPGKEWKPTEQEKHLPRPSGVEKDGKITRGDGIVAKKLVAAE